MLLCLDVGNTHIMGGIYDNKKLCARFRYATHLVGTSDQLGMFLYNVIRANNLEPENIKAVAVCSVVPSVDYTLRHCVKRYFDVPFFALKAGVKTGLNIKTKNPSEVGADLIATAIGAVDEYPNRNIIVIDMGTATTLCAITKQKDYLGVSILPGIRLSMEALTSGTAKLNEVDIETPESYIGRTTRECIQSGLYFGHLGALRELLSGFKREAFGDEESIVIATGGFSQMYKDQKLFDEILPDLVLQGLMKAYSLSV